MVKTVLECFDQLKPIQKQYIVNCVREYMRKDFHLGLLPFLPIEDALRVLKRKREVTKTWTQGGGPKQEGYHNKPSAYVTRIINILAPHTEFEIHPDEMSRVIMLSDMKLALGFRRRYSKTFCIYLISRQDGKEWSSKDRSLPTAQLQWVHKNKWRITCHPKVIDVFVDWLTETYR